MFHLRNQGGSTLLLTLIIMVVFSILFLTLATGSISNTLQIKKTEVDIQTNSLADMGAVYHRSAVVTKLLSLAVDEEVFEEIDEEFSNEIVNNYAHLDPVEDEVELRELYLDIVLDHWIRELNNLEKIYSVADRVTNEMNLNSDQVIVQLNDEFFKVNQHNVEHRITSNGERVLVVKFVSTGNQSDKELQLDTGVTIPIRGLFELEELEVPDPEGSGNSGNNGGGNGSTDPEPESFPDGSFIKEPVITTPCIGTNTTNVECVKEGNHSVSNSFDDSIIKVIGDMTITGNTNQNNNSTVWVGGDLTARNFNSANIDLHVGGDATFSHNANNLVNSTIEILGDATFGSNIQNVSDTIIFVGRNLNVNGHLDLKNESIVYVGGILDIDGKLDVSRNSKVCVMGELKVKNGITAYNNVYASSSNKSSGVNTNEKDFEDNCFVAGQAPTSATKLIPILKPSPNIRLDDIELETEYTYN